MVCPDSYPLSQVRFVKISSYTLGYHVLILAQVGILFSFGSNKHGQLGLGINPSPNDPHQIPTRVTPLLENGGKTIDCAAGVTHSLVFFKTDCMRIV